MAHASVDKVMRDNHFREVLERNEEAIQAHLTEARAQLSKTEQKMRKIQNKKRAAHARALSQIGSPLRKLS